MNKSKSLWLTIIAVVACIGCCSVPLYAIFVGSAGLAVLLSQTTVEILKCVLPLGVLGVGYWVYQKRQAKKICCTSENAKCGNDHCGTHSGDER